MTKVYAEVDGNRYLISADGHATGSADMCTAISAIIYALAGYLSNNPRGITDISSNLSDGKAIIRFSGDDAAKAVFDMTVIGLLQLEQHDKDHISVDLQNIF